ncbi:MAG: PilZ domain-containing protein [Gammaproteobacteria bacterium]
MSDADFIAHPPQFPLRFRRHSLLPWRAPAAPDGGGDIGLSFHSSKYLPAGARIDLEIPLRGTTQRFSATVVLVREQADGYEIGLWFASPDDASRARIVEKICRTECYLRSREAPQN